MFVSPLMSHAATSWRSSLVTLGSASGELPTKSMFSTRCPADVLLEISVIIKEAITIRHSLIIEFWGKFTPRWLVYSSFRVDKILKWLTFAEMPTLFFSNFLFDKHESPSVGSKLLCLSSQLMMIAAGNSILWARPVGDKHSKVRVVFLGFHQAP